MNNEWNSWSRYGSTNTCTKLSALRDSLGFQIVSSKAKIFFLEKIKNRIYFDEKEIEKEEVYPC